MPNVSNIVKSIQDIMRKDAGTYGDAQRLEQLGWMFFLKIFDDREKELDLLRDNYKSPIPRELRWSTWAADEEGITGDDAGGFAHRVAVTVRDGNAAPGSLLADFLDAEGLVDPDDWPLSDIAGALIVEKGAARIETLTGRHPRGVVRMSGDVARMRQEELAKQAAECAAQTANAPAAMSGQFTMSFKTLDVDLFAATRANRMTLTFPRETDSAVTSHRSARNGFATGAFPGCIAAFERRKFLPFGRAHD